MRILLIGSGGREHALAWSISASPLCEELIAAPGNAGIAELARCIAVAAGDIDGLVRLAREERIDLVVVGPEQPLVLGLIDRLEEAGIPAFGPSGAAARLEGSKAFMKEFAGRHGIATAAHRRFGRDHLPEALAYIRELTPPVVIKADGLAAGKGVIIAATAEEAVASATASLSGSAFGSAGQTIIVEEHLEGEEVSVFALCDGEVALAFGAAQDHKRAFDGDLGPNTGGMGAYSPPPVLTSALEREIRENVIGPTLRGLTAEGTPFKGFLFAGIMLTAEGPKLLEYNVRLGDPEAQTLIVRLKSDLLPALLAARDGVLKSFDLRWREEAALTVVLAAEGYPGEPRTGGVIEGLEDAAEVEGVTLFHAGTKRAADRRLVAAGGRVLNVTALGHSIAEARDRAYQAVDRIRWTEGFCRRDIGWRALSGS
ncbi:MAG TPA: phosphoribosylamine--glycine ligase [Alphaproteobacteria bacterium]|nr:phosphoribosylamine--glycine ligase [Alphaproteobacteria bacterium]